jgi:hypothetical protein
MPHFGPRKIGKARFDALQLREQATKKFGPRKFGKRKAAEMLSALEEAESRVTAPVVEGEIAATSIKQLREVLSDNPTMADELYAAELARPAGPRKQAVKLFLSIEFAREDGARPDRQAELEGLLQA